MKNIAAFTSAILLMTGAWASGREIPDETGGFAPGLIEMKIWVHVNDVSGRPIQAARVGLNVALDSGGSFLSAPTDDIGQLGETDNNSVCELSFEVLPNPDYKWRASGWVKKKGYIPFEIHDVVLRGVDSGDENLKHINVTLRPIEAAAAPSTVDLPR